MNQSAPLNRWLTTAIGGIIFLLPLVFLLVLLGYVYQAVVWIYVLAKPLIPFDSGLAITLLLVGAVLALLLVCYVAGLLAQRALAQRLSKSIEAQILKVFPKYGVYRDLIAGRLGGPNDSHLKPVLVTVQGLQRIAFMTDRLGDHECMVYLPGAPDPWNGSIAIVPLSSVAELSLTFVEAVELCETLGRNASEQLRK